MKYVHTNLVAKDWRSLARFYIEVFDCELVPPERDLRGEALEGGTGIPGVHLTGAHLRLPGYDENGPTLEVFSYDPADSGSAKTINRLGFGHIAFMVDDVAAVRGQVLARGGKAIGQIVTTPIGDTGHFYQWCYVTDPEGNALELQVKK